MLHSSFKEKDYHLPVSVQRTFPSHFFALVFAILGATNLSTSVDADEGCVNHQELLAGSEIANSEVTPCDQIGVYFLVGLGLDDSGLLLSDSIRLDGQYLQQYPYYFFARIYLYGLADPFGGGESVDPEERFGEMVGQLMGIMAALDHGSIGEGQESAERKSFYKVYALGEYLKLIRRAYNASTDQGMFRFPHANVFSNPSLEAIVALMHVEMQDARFVSHAELECFILNDIPVLSVDEVVESERFQACLRK